MHSFLKSQLWLLPLFWLLCGSLSGQQYQLTWIAAPEDQKLIGKTNRSFSDSISTRQFVQDKLTQLQALGYLQTTFESSWQGSNLLVQAIVGAQFDWVRLKANNIDRHLLQKAGYRQRYYRDKPFRHQEVAALMQDILNASNNLGYPFARVSLDSVAIEEAQVSAQLNLQPGPFIQFEGIQIKGDVKIQKHFLQQYLKLNPQSPYAEEQLDQITPRLARLPYLQLKNPPGLSFQNDEATVYLELEPRAANRLDGVIGFLPNAKSDGSLLLTGQFNLLLQNMFGGGRTVEVKWESFKPQSQQLRIDFKQPLIFRSPINVNAGFHLLKEDSTFLNTHIDLRMVYDLNASSTFDLFARIKTTRLSSNTNLEQISTLGDLVDFDLNTYGLAYVWQQLDDPFSPTRGTKIHLELAAGTKKIRRNGSITDSLYNDLEFNTPQLTWSVSADRYWNLSKRIVLYTGARAAGINNKRLFFNDLFRLGGLNSLRGFSENTLFAEEFFYTTFEPRFYLDGFSYLFVFYDQAWWLNYQLEEQDLDDHPSGLGAGINLRTTFGNFNLAWAVGRAQQQQLGLAQSKIHFGYVTTF